mgnify:FL=1
MLLIFLTAKFAKVIAKSASVVVCVSPPLEGCPKGGVVIAPIETISFCAGVYFVSSLRSGGAKDLVESGKQLLKLLILKIV